MRPNYAFDRPGLPSPRASGVMTRTPGRIALVGASATALALMTATLGMAVFHLAGVEASPGYAVLSAIIEALTIGALVWCGTYIGARATPIEQRGNGLTVWLASIYFTAGIALSLPIKTHAVLVHFSAPDAHGSPVPVTGSITISLIPLAAVLLLPIAVTRILAMVLARGKGRDA
jgi:hypothetical protein